MAKDSESELHPVTSAEGQAASGIPPADVLGTEPQQKAGPIYYDFLEKLIAEQDQRKDSLERRALAVITTSGTLVSLLFGLVSVLTKAEHFSLPRASHSYIAAALILFVSSAFLAIVTNAPILYRNIDPSDVDAVLKENWSEDRDFAEQIISTTRSVVFKTAQKVNEFKAWTLVAALVLQVGAAATLAVAVAEIIFVKGPK